MQHDPQTQAFVDRIFREMGWPMASRHLVTFCRTTAVFNAEGFQFLVRRLSDCRLELRYQCVGQHVTTLRFHTRNTMAVVERLMRRDEVADASVARPIRKAVRHRPSAPR